MEQVPRANATNSHLAEILGVTVGQISRIRNGKRQPSINLMFTISKELGWSTEEQVKAAVWKGYHHSFEAFLRSKYGE